MKNQRYIGVRIRIVSGMILYVYTITHLLNHALGVVSWEVMEQGRIVFLELWRNPFVLWLLPGPLKIRTFENKR